MKKILISCRKNANSRIVRTYTKLKQTCMIEADLLRSIIIHWDFTVIQKYPQVFPFAFNGVVDLVAVRDATPLKSFKNSLGWLAL